MRICDLRLRIGVLAIALFAAAAEAREQRTADFAGGCFWGVEAVFEHLRGVESVVSGYVSGVETVRVTYDPDAIGYRQLLEVFFRVAHDPTSRDRQGPDAGPEYRAIVFYGDEAERQEIDGYLAEIGAARMFVRPIVTEVRRRGAFAIAEPSHQDFVRRNPDDAYVVANDLPKLAKLRLLFPDLVKLRPRPDVHRVPRDRR